MFSLSLGERAGVRAGWVTISGVHWKGRPAWLERPMVAEATSEISQTRQCLV